MTAQSDDILWLDEKVHVTIAELAECTGVPEEVLRELVEYGALEPADPRAGDWTFRADWVVSVRTAARVCNDLELETRGARPHPVLPGSHPSARGRGAAPHRPARRSAAMRLSVLDQSPAAQDKSQDHAIRESLALARHCDALGYHRYWVSEHHNSASIVGTAPEILMAAIAATTTRIRIGSAGVMLPHYAALKVAEQFRVLEAIAPGRIDLGVGRAPGSDRLTAMALNPDPHAADNFPRQIQEMDLWLRGEPLPEGHPFRAIHAHPMGPTSPEIWILGSSDYGAQLAAYLGYPYAYAYFFTEGRGTEEALALYREQLPAQRALSEGAGDDLRLGAGGGYGRRKRGACS